MTLLSNVRILCSFVVNLAIAESRHYSSANVAVVCLYMLLFAYVVVCLYKYGAIEINKHLHLYGTNVNKYKLRG